THLWKWAGFNMVVCLAALHALPSEVMEAAELDNCGWVRKTIFMILPMIRGTLIGLLILSFVGKMKVFDLVWVMTEGGPLWTTEISASHYGLPSPAHWQQYVTSWTVSNYRTYFWNSCAVVVAAVALTTVIGAMAAHALARYRFRGNRAILFLIFSTIIFPAQITLLALFQILVKYELFNTLTGLTLVYVATQLPLTIYILEAFFARTPQDLFDAA